MSESINSSRRSFIYTGLVALPLLNLEVFADCKLTTPSQEGPFYRAGAAWLSGAPGGPLGRRGGDGTPLGLHDQAPSQTSSSEAKTGPSRHTR